MRRLVLLSFLLLVVFSGAIAAERAPSPIVGEWKYSSLFYRGQEIPRPNPTLKLLFEYNADLQSRIYWSYDGEPGFCERRGSYQLETIDGAPHFVLEDLVTWINPGNRFDCAQDPDMRLGRRTHNKVEFKGERLWLEVLMGDEPLYYILERVQK